MPSTILRPHYLTFRNRIRFGAKGTFGLRRDGLLLVITGTIVVCIFAAVWMLLNVMSSKPEFLAILPSRMVSISLHYFLFLLLLSNTVAAMGNLYAADNMNLLLLTPISRFRLFAAKFIETCFETSMMYFVLLGPAALAFSLYLKLPAGFLLHGLVLSIPFLAIPTAVGIVISTFLAHLVSLIWRRGAILFFGIIVAVVYGIARVTGFLTEVKGKHRGGEAIAQMVGLYGNDASPLLPSQWLGDVLNTYLSIPNEFTSEKIILLFSLSIGLIALSYLVFDLLLLPVRSRAAALSFGLQPDSDEKKRTRRARRDFARTIIETFVGCFPHDQQTRAIIVKDLSCLIRDRAQALQLMLYLGLVSLYVVVSSFMSAAINLNDVALRLWHATLSSMNFLISGFLLTTVFTRLIFPSVSLEGKAFWILQVTPIDVPHLVRAKLLGWFPIAFLLATSLMLVGSIALGSDILLACYSLGLGAALALGGTGLAIGLGAMFASFDWESPNQISVGIGSLVLLLSNVTMILFLTPVAALGTFFVSIPELSMYVGGKTVATAIPIACLLFITIVTLRVAKFTCAKGVKRLAYRRGDIM